MAKEGKTGIQISKKTWKILNGMKEEAETFESVILKLINSNNKGQEIASDPKPILDESEIDEVVF